MGTDSRFLFLVRHGATEANQRRPSTLQGQRCDQQLSDLGRRQAAAAGQALSRFAIRSVFSSPLRRARQTAEFIAQPHGLGVQVVAALTECDVGRWEGLSWESICRSEPQAYQQFMADPASVPYAGGESFQQVHDRAVPAIEHLLADEPDGHLVVVTHNIVGRVYLAALLGLPLAKARTIWLDNGGISLVRVCSGSASVQTLNSVFHLGSSALC